MKDPNPRIRRALISLSDKTGLEQLAHALAERNVELISTGGTAAKLKGAGFAVSDVADVTGFPEILDGRVKTLHPKIHGGLLAVRGNAEHISAAEEHKIEPIDLLIVNLYPFESTVASGASFVDCVENIDIGGPAMIRAAAKNHASVTVIVDQADFEPLLAEMSANAGRTTPEFRKRLAAKAYARTAAYDAAISNWLGAVADSADGSAKGFPPTYTTQYKKALDMRYGENPHQRGAFYVSANAESGTVASARQLLGKELSYNNVADSDAAWECVKTFAEPACVIVKHANPCGVAIAATPLDAYRKALATDPTSAFGGIIAFNRPVDAATVEAVAAQFLEVLIAPAYTDDALAVIAKKANVRVLEVPLPAGGGANAWDMKRVGGGLLVQSPDTRNVDAAELKVVTKLAPTPAQLTDLLFAWRVAKYVKSNAIVYCRDGQTLGIGAGQMSRVDSTRIAAMKAANAGLPLAGSVVASDAFFPFRDGLDVVADNGAAAVIQPGGSMRDAEVIAAADERGIAMVFTGVRHFRH